jgi:hypothetical protein
MKMSPRNLPFPWHLNFGRLLTHIKICLLLSHSKKVRLGHLFVDLPSGAFTKAFRLVGKVIESKAHRRLNTTVREFVLQNGMQNI